MAVVPVQRIAQPAKIFAIVNCGWLLVLALLFFGYWNEYVLFPQLAGLNVAKYLQGHDPIGGIVPTFVPWAGALGGVTISLIGCVRYSRSWDSKMNMWHALRPVLGAVAASIGFVILVLVLKVAAGTQFDSDVIPTNPGSQGLFFIIGFLLGFREGLFLDLVQKIASMILTTGTAAARTEIELDRNGIEFGEVEVGDSRTALVNVTLIEPKSATSLTFSSVRVVGGQPFAARVLPASPFTPLIGAVEVSFSPQAAGPFNDQLEVVVGAVTSLVELTGTALAPRPALVGAGPQPAIEARKGKNGKKGRANGNGNGNGKP